MKKKDFFIFIAALILMGLIMLVIILVSAIAPDLIPMGIAGGAIISFIIIAFIAALDFCKKP